MDPRKLQFLQAVVGDDGARALVKAAEQVAGLDHAIFPRTILAWIEVTSRFGYQGTVPGMEDVQLSFRKSENGFDGFVTLDGQLHKFEEASIDHLAGCVAVALGLDHELPSGITPQKIVKLGKSIDLLVKSRVVKKKLGKDEKKPGDKKVNLPGVAAQPRGPQAPIAPTPTQPKNQKQAAQGAAGTAMSTPLPQVSAPKKKPQAQITKSQANGTCRMCGKKPFTQGKYVGCLCFSTLAKHVKTFETNAGFTLEFTGLDQDEILTLLDGLKGK